MWRIEPEKGRVCAAKQIQFYPCGEYFGHISMPDNTMERIYFIYTYIIINAMMCID